MLRVFALFLLAAVLGTVSTVPLQPASAEDVSKKVRSACTGDVKRLCPKHKFGSSELRYCMEANGRNLSRSCVMALEDDGIVPRGMWRKS